MLLAPIRKRGKEDTLFVTSRMLDPKALDAAFGRLLADVATLIQDGGVIAVDGKARRGTRDAGKSAQTRIIPRYSLGWP